MVGSSNAGGDLMNSVRLRERLLTSATTPSPSPVAGYTLWLDGRDGIFDTSYNRLTDGTAAQTCYLYDRATNGYFLQQRFEAGGLFCSAQNGIFNYVSANQYMSDQKIVGNIANVKTLDITFMQNVEISSGTEGYNLFLASGTDRFFYRGSRSWYARSAAAGYARVVLAGVTTINHYVVTLDDSGIARIYKNGELVATSTSTYSALETTDTILKLYANAGLSGQTVTQIASVRTYETSFGQTEVTQNYNYELSTGRLTA
jgi:hypothetical protein